MSKLDSFIRRMQAQRDCLDYAAKEIRHLPGPALELGLGNGRTYDHLKEKMPDRDIYVFDRRLSAYKSCTPPKDLLFLGEVTETLPLAAQRLGKTAALVHIDLGTTDVKANAKLLDAIAPLLAPLVCSGGIIVSNQALSFEGWENLPEPPGVKPGRYFLYRVD
ncbi:class I SAM-dependent methyltransferase [Thermodesulfobacteriota bacterium]